MLNQSVGDDLTLQYTADTDGRYRPVSALTWLVQTIPTVTLVGLVG